VRYDTELDLTGAFYFEVPPGEYEVTVLGRSSQPAIRTVVTAGQRSRVDF
jgi:hypothetical protein